jgi:type IV secretion system protein VirD4
MISRSETARPLLTAGEVMQLPPDDEIVMVAGVPPVRAKKARYFEDARFKERLLPVPQNPKAGLAPKPDDWSALTPVTVPAGKTAVAPGAVVVMNGAVKPDDDPANGGLRREPGLERHKDIAPEPARNPANEFDPDADEPEREVVANRALARDMRLMARRIALDPGDGMEL